MSDSEARGPDSDDESRPGTGRRGRGRPGRRGYRAADGESADPGSGAGGRGRRGHRSSGAGSADSGLPGGGTEAQAKDVCLRLLTDRARSRSELATKLADKGYSEAIANKVLDRLAEVGLIDDAAFAQQWVQSRHTYSGKGKRALAQELKRKGVAQEDAEEALSAISSDDEHARATDLVRRKLRTLPRDLDREKAIRRLVGMLARRGYNSGTAYAVVKAELAGAGNDFDASELD
ncbi:recombination regulator RecX [Nocardia inohanensis]|uniref:recombination regulator RecX n=1 Tax=Nocardia inohanensis TaxID=209246 RepID=UPI0009FE274E